MAAHKPERILFTRSTDKQGPPILRAARCQRHKPQALLMAIFFSLFWACSVFGSVTVSTPFLK
jgi:hypothetical protein